MTKKETLAQEHKDAIARLKAYGIKPGSTIYTNCVYTSRSGMLRKISVYVIAKYNKKPYPADISYLVCKAIGGNYDHKKQAINMGGCGMDMGFAIVYSLGLAMWPKGTSKPHGTRNGVPDSDGGYALKQEWL